MGPAHHPSLEIFNFGRLRSVLLPVSLAVLVGLAIAVAAYRYPLPSLSLVLAGGLAFLAVVALAIARYDAAVLLGMCLLGVVNVEPAPPDAVLFVVISIAAATGRLDLERLPMIVIGALGAFITLNLLSALEAVDPARAGFFFTITLYLALFAIWLTSYVRSERAARLVLIGYLVAAVGSVVLAMGALYGGFPGSDYLVYQETRARGFFKDANVFGPFMVPAALIMVEEILRPRLLRIGTPTKSLIVLILFVGVIFSFSRAAWLNLGIGVVVMIGMLVLRRDGGARLMLVLGVLAFAGLATAATVVATGQDTFLQERAELQQYDTERFGAQETGLELAQRKPLGIGPGQFEPVIQYGAHSTYVRVFTEQGIFGLLAWLVIVLSTLALAVSNAARARSAYGIGSAALLGAWVGLIANSFFVDTLHWRHLWLVAALIWLTATRRAWDRQDARASVAA